MVTVTQNLVSNRCAHVPPPIIVVHSESGQSKIHLGPGHTKLEAIAFCSTTTRVPLHYYSSPVIRRQNEPHLWCFERQTKAKPARRDCLCASNATTMFHIY
jgi:hypothetical protein